MRKNKWEMNRAGLLNFWYYDDEVFDFADGKLLLRGSNGSGKSVTMQSILPVLLDGKTSSDRLDPFGSRARKIEDYLLGEKEIVNRDERTGYLFLEYKRKESNQYITTGIGLQARRNKPLNFWGFLLTDNRRIRKDFDLYEYEYHGGDKQKIPLSRTQLENRIGNGGYVVRTRREYQQLVNKYIFGFESEEAFEDLIKLLIQLRSPKLSRDFRPTVIYEILEASLPALTDEDLRHLSDTIEYMDQTKQQIEQLDREYEALKKIVRQYDQYNYFRLVDTAKHFLETNRRYKKEGEKIQNKRQLEQRLETDIKHMLQRKQALKRTLDVFEQKKIRLENHKVWNLEEERIKEKEKVQEIQAEIERKDEQLRMKKRQLFQQEQEKDHLAIQFLKLESEINDQLIDMDADADIASFSQHSLNVQDFKRHLKANHNFHVWFHETEMHEKRLNEIREKLRTYETLKEAIEDLDLERANLKLEMDQFVQEKNDWERLYEQDQQKLMTKIYKWVKQHSFLEVTSQVLQETSRNISFLYEILSYDQIRAPYVQLTNDFQMLMKEKIADKNSQQKQLDQVLKEAEDELEVWKNKRDPEPPYRQKETTEARLQLMNKGYDFIPLYEAVEFKEHVPSTLRKRIEAVLLESGLLDALITVDDQPIVHDRILRPKPHLMAHTLADYLTPDLDEDAPISKEIVDEVLRSIVIDEQDEETSMSMLEDGSYKIGMIQGHAAPVEQVRYIGKNARKRYRKEQIERLLAEINKRKEEKKRIQLEISALHKNIQKAKEAIQEFPSDDDLQEIHSHIKEKQFQIDQLEKIIKEKDENLQKFYTKFQQTKRQLNIETKELNIEFSYEAYEEAQKTMRRYERDLYDLKNKHLYYGHCQTSMKRVSERIEELTEEIDTLSGEVNVLNDQKIRVNHNITEIEKQLNSLGVVDIRKQIQNVQKEISDANLEMDDLRRALPQKEVDRNTLQVEISSHQQKEKFWKLMMTAWKQVFKEEVNLAFVEIPSDINDLVELARFVQKKYRQFLREKDAGYISSQLTQVFYEQHTNLMEYRMTDHSLTPEPFAWMDEDWTDEQKIFIIDWKNKSPRRFIELEFQSQRVSPYFMLERIEKDRTNQKMLLDEQDRQLYEEILYDSIGRKIRSRIYRAQMWTKQMNELMKESDSSSGLLFSIRWRPRTAENEKELDTKDLVELLSRDVHLLKEQDLQQVIEHFRSKIEQAKELLEIKGVGNTLLQVLKEVLDYRQWFSFVLFYKREGESQRELTNNAFYQFSGGEKAMAMYIPLFTACYSRYLEASEEAPYIISLDEAFAGVDEDNIRTMFQLVENLKFNYIMNSQVLWGDYDTVNSLSICELIRPKNADYVSIIRYLWDGERRTLLLDEDAEEDYVKI